MRASPPAALAAAFAIVAAGCAGKRLSAGSSSGTPRNPAAVVEGEPYRPRIDPADFVDTIDNPYLPLTPGTTRFYEGI